MSFSFVVRNDKFHSSAQRLKQKTEKLTPLHHFDSFWVCITEIRTDSCSKIVNNNNKENCYQSWDILEKQVETSSFNNHENVKKRKKGRNNNE